MHGLQPSEPRESACVPTTLTECALAVLVSGSGTILRAMFEEGLPVTTVLADRPLRRAGPGRGVLPGRPPRLVDRAPYGGFGPDFDRAGFTATVAAALVAHQVDLVAMAGFGTVMTEAVHRAFPGRILNTHPEPAAGLPWRWHGVRGTPWPPGWRSPAAPSTWPLLEMDAGPILAQESVPVLPDDTEETLHERIKVVERSLYPATVAWALGELPRPVAGSSRSGPAGRCGPTARGAICRQRFRTQQRSTHGDDVMRALLSVYDKEGLLELAQGLADLDWELVASGNTSAALTEAGIAHLGVADVTGSPEMLGERGEDPAPQIPRRDPGRPLQARAP